MASNANSTTAPFPEPLSLFQLKGLYIFADAARWVVDEDRDVELRLICDGIIDRLVEAPARTQADAMVKLWLIGHAGEREWDFDYCTRPVLEQVRRFLIGGRA